MDRRNFLKASLATAVAPFVPTVAAAAPVAVPPPNPLHPVWAVGTEEGRDWILTRAPTLKDAQEIWRSEQGCYCMDDCDEETAAECEDCQSPIGHRVKALDDKLETTGRNEAAAIAGWINECERCGADEVWPDDYHVLANDECVCDECMTLADWREVNPQRYEELCDELLTEEYGPDLRFPQWW